MLKAATPGPYTSCCPRHARRRDGCSTRSAVPSAFRVPDNVVTQALLAELGEPLMSSTLMLPGDELPLTDAPRFVNVWSIRLKPCSMGGNCGVEPTTVVDLAATPPVVVRQGRGPVDIFGL